MLYSIVKTFEVRDRNTYIPVMAMQAPLVNDLKLSWHRRDRTLFYSAGYTTPESLSDLIVIVHLQNGKAHADEFNWRDRTMNVAHNYINQHFATLESGSVIDVEYILGETSEPKRAQEW